MPWRAPWPRALSARPWPWRPRTAAARWRSPAQAASAWHGALDATASGIARKRCSPKASTDTHSHIKPLHRMGTAIVRAGNSRRIWRQKQDREGDDNKNVVALATAPAWSSCRAAAFPAPAPPSMPAARGGPAPPRSQRHATALVMHDRLDTVLVSQQAIQDHEHCEAVSSATTAPTFLC